MKTLVAVPCMDTVPVGFVNSLMHLIEFERSADEYRPTQVDMHQSSLIYDARNLLSLKAINENYDRILWIDSDITVPANTAYILHNHLDAGHDIATALYVQRKPPILPVIYSAIREPFSHDGRTEQSVVRYLDYPSNTTFPVAGFGFGCVMMTTAILKQMWDKFGPPFAPFVWAGEDISFCYRAGLIHADMICDSSIRCGHIGQIQFSPDYYEQQRGDTH